MKQLKAAIWAVILACLIIAGIVSLPIFVILLVFTGCYIVVRIIQEDEEK